MARKNGIHRNRLSGSGGDLPRLELIKITRRGAILRSSRAYETGDTLALGLQMVPGASQRFVDVEGFVVQCRRLMSPATGTCYEVTLAFGELSDDECHAVDDACTHWNPRPWRSVFSLN